MFLNGSPAPATGCASMGHTDPPCPTRASGGLDRARVLFLTLPGKKKRRQVGDAGRCEGPPIRREAARVGPQMMTSIPI